MISLHLLDNIYFFSGHQEKINQGICFYWQRITAIVFLILVGVSLALSHSKVKAKGRSQNSKLFIKYLKRGLIIFSWGLITTIVTKLFLKDGFIIFGILHLIGVSIILSFPFLSLRFGNLFLGIILIGLGFYFKNFQFSFPWLLWLIPKQFFTVDYFPVLPWFGLILIGLFLGNILYPNYTRGFRLHNQPHLRVVKWFCFLGKNSLVIYLIHQPLFISLLSLIGVVKLS